MNRRLMGFPRLAALFLGSLVSSVPALAEPADTRMDPWLAVHAYCGEDGCLIVPPKRQLRPGDGLVLFEPGKDARPARVAFLVNADSARRVFDEQGYHAVTSDPVLSRRVGCYWSLKGESFESLAHYELNDGTSDGLPVALQGLPASAISVGGNGTPLQPKELESIVLRLGPSVPAGFTGRRTLRAGRRYTSRRAHELIELYLGRAAYGRKDPGSPIDSVEIARLFILNDRVLATERLSRVSGVEEHVDLEPPQLDERNWYQTTEDTAGFLSLDGGSSWNRITLDVGFEGIAWTIIKLEKDLPIVWEFYLYTSH